jgi:hypothetical protein
MHRRLPEESLTQTRQFADNGVDNLWGWCYNGGQRSGYQERLAAKLWNLCGMP